jgi:hypothetical protein
MDIAVVDSGANLVAFLRMDGALLGSIAVASTRRVPQPRIAVRPSFRRRGAEVLLEIRPDRR